VRLSDNVERAMWVMQRARAAEAEVYLYVSSGGAVYGESLRDKLCETDPCAPISGYGLEKLFAENAAKMLHRTERMDVRILRPSNPYGPSQIGDRVQGLVGYLVHAMKVGNPISQFGDATKDYIYIDDLIEGFVKVLECGESGEIYNLGSGEGVSTSRLIQQVAESLSLDPFSLQVKRLPKRTFDPGRNILNTSKASSQLRWEPKTNLCKGLSQMTTFVKQTDCMDNDEYK
jgi:UDP-glucose 4-epimerase